jgi:hypothetical protein
MDSPRSAADFYRRQASQQPPMSDFFLMYLAIVNSFYHGADDAGKQLFRCIMRYLLSVELMLILLGIFDVHPLMLVVRIIVLICAFFNAEFIPMLTQSLWTKVCSYAPVVWQWLCDNAQVGCQWLCEQWRHVRQYLAEQREATERGRREQRVHGRRLSSPDGRPSSQHVEQEKHEQLLLMNGENHSEERGQGVGLYLPDGRASSQDVEQQNTRQFVSINDPSNVGEGLDHLLSSYDSKSDVEEADHQDHQSNKRKRDENLPAEPESEPVPERACQKQRT